MSKKSKKELEEQKKYWQVLLKQTNVIEKTIWKKSNCLDLCSDWKKKEKAKKMPIWILFTMLGNYCCSFQHHILLYTQPTDNNLILLLFQQKEFTNSKTTFWDVWRRQKRPLPPKIWPIEKQEPAHILNLNMVKLKNN